MCRGFPCASLHEASRAGSRLFVNNSINRRCDERGSGCCNTFEYVAAGDFSECLGEWRGGGAGWRITSAALDGGADASANAPPEPLPPLVADNQVKPVDGVPFELTQRAKGLFEAIVNDEPARGDPFWFPKEPFIPLKDVKGPDKYWDNLHRAYAADIHKAHKKQKSWDGAVFSDFKPGSTPKWVKPGEEANKIGYYRSFHGKIRYELDGKTYSIDVHTVITWQGRWYVTHLGKFKK